MYRRLIATLKEKIWLRISGICGVLTPIVAFTCIFLAIASWPAFNWTDNALSDLGVQEGITPVLFNNGLIISGILALVFSSGLPVLVKEKTLAKIGTVILVLADLALIAIGIFPETARPMHFYASVAFFMFYPTSMFFYVAAFIQMSKAKTAVFTFLIGIAASAAWIIQWAIGFGSGVAIPETIAALSASMWSLVMGFKMLRQASQSNR